MKKSRLLPLAAIALSTTGAFDQASAQERYDDHELRDRFRISLGGFESKNISSRLRVDSKDLGLGTIIDLEDDLNLDDSVVVGRMDGFYRFNRAHRIEWTSYSLTRNGYNTIDKEITIGDTVFPINYTVDSTWKFKINKIGYSWSFINVDKYEMFLGAGVNYRKMSLTFEGRGGALLQEERMYESGTSLPLPTVTAGIRYNNLAKAFKNFPKRIVLVLYSHRD